MKSRIVGTILLLAALGLGGWWWLRSDLPRIDWRALKGAMRQRIDAMRARGIVPLFDVEAHYDARAFPLDRVIADFDASGIAVSAMQPRWSPEQARESGLDGWQGLNLQLPVTGCIMPVACASLHAFIREGSDAAFLDATLAAAARGGYPMLGEFSFRHYPRNREYEEGERDPTTDYDIPIDGPGGETIFAWAQRHHVVFQIHYEVEDRLLPPLEAMLAKYPEARVIWCHVGRVRYPSRARSYDAGLVERLIQAHPNLYFDTSDARTHYAYEANGEVSTMMWDNATGHLKRAWRDLIARHPERFLAALDFNSARPAALSARVRRQRAFLAELAPTVAEAVAWRSAWRLLFGEEADVPLRMENP